MRSVADAQDDRTAPDDSGFGLDSSEARPGRRWVLGLSLRSKIIAAFAAIIFLTLLLVLTGLLLVLRQYQEQRETIRLGSLAGPLSFQVRALEQQGATAEEIMEFLEREADDLDARIVVARPQGVIFYDTDGTLVGHRIDIQAAQRFGPLRRARLVTAQDAGDRRIFFIAAAVPQQASGFGQRFGGRPSAYVVALVSEPLTIGAVVGEIAPRLVLPTLLALLASIGVAWLLAASIARPIARMTHAAEQIARGRYDQSIPESGADEVGRLTAAFNTMAREVARSQRTLRDFVANVSHDLRTPLTSIRGFSQAIVDGAVRDREEYAEAGRIINQEAERMRRLVDDLLELSTIESGQAALSLQPVELAAAARQAVERVERRATENGVDVVEQIDVAPLVRADTGRLERVLDNLLGNAVKHTPPGGRITVRVAGRSEGGARQRDRVDRAIVSIHNSGSVIPAEDLPRIFERFYQVDKSRAGSAEGSGLGLSIAREIVLAHGGVIQARSSPEDGTEFIVTLPALDLGAQSALASEPGIRRESVAHRLRAT